MDEFYIEINIDQNSKDLNLLFDAIKKVCPNICNYTDTTCKNAMSNNEWRNMDDDMKEISKQFPNRVISFTFENVGTNERERVYYYNGQMQSVSEIKEIPEFDISKLHQEESNLQEERVLNGRNVGKFHFTMMEKEIQGFKSGAIAEITRIGQDRPASSNKVRVCVTIYLPTENDKLIDNLRFGNNCRIFSKYLYEDWGFACDEDLNPELKYVGWRYEWENIVCETWKEAFDRAEELVLKELGELDRLIEEREQALIDAEYYVE